MLEYVLVEDAEAFELALHPAPFRCLLLVQRGVARQTMRAICMAIADAGCRYAMTWGPESEEWHDMFDAVVGGQTGAGGVAPDCHMMTTWHHGEDLGEAIFFAKHLATTSSDGKDLVDFIVVDLGAVDRDSLVRSLYKAA